MTAPTIGEPVDLEALLAHASRASEGLEEAWSAALRNVQHDETRELLAARWSSVVTAMMESTKELDRRLEEAGFEARLPERPPFAEAARNLDLAAAGAVRLRNGRMAQLLAFEALAQAVGALTETSDVSQRESDPFMSKHACAFAAVRDRATLVARLTRLVSLQEAELTGTGRPAASATPEGLARLSLADGAWARGDPEAALLHLQLAARNILADLLSVTDRALPISVGERLVGSPTLSELGMMLRAAEELTSGLASGHNIQLDGSTLLVPNLLEALRSLATRPPIGLLRQIFYDLPTAGGGTCGDVIDSD